MKKHQPEMVEIQLNKKEPSQKPTSPPKAQVPYSRTIAKIETPHQTIEIYHGMSIYLLHTFIQGILRLPKGQNPNDSPTNMIFILPAILHILVWTI